jgi:hypothetical protein
VARRRGDAGRGGGDPAAALELGRRREHERLGYDHHQHHAGIDPWLSAELVLPSFGLCWQGGTIGAVMHGNDTFALTWDPNRSYWAGTRYYVEQFLRDVADGSGTLTSPYDVTTAIRRATVPSRGGGAPASPISSFKNRCWGRSPQWGGGTRAAALHAGARDADASGCGGVSRFGRHAVLGQQQLERTVLLL